METTIKQTILNQLKEQCPSSVVDTIHWPEAYCLNKENVRAIVLGCDPSNQHDRQLKYAFGIDTETKRLKQFFTGIERNLEKVGLKRDKLYVQNLCQNYFKDVTSKNKDWIVAAKIWLPYLKEELDSLPIPIETPVFMTAGIIYKALLKESVKVHKPKDLYFNMELLPISPADNHLGRPLYPLFRGGNGYYDLNGGKWEGYVEFLKGRFFTANV